MLTTESHVHLIFLDYRLEHTPPRGGGDLVCGSIDAHFTFYCLVNGSKAPSVIGIVACHYGCFCLAILVKLSQ